MDLTSGLGAMAGADRREYVRALQAVREPPPGDAVVLAGRPSTANRVHGELWMGAYPPPDSRPGRHFDCLVLCAREYVVPECFGDMQVASAALNDDGSPMTDDERRAAVRAAGTVIRWSAEGNRVLITCMQGRNRSGLVCALTLCKGPARMTPEQAVRAVRAARGETALVNPDFLRFLHAYCGR